MNANETYDEFMSRVSERAKTFEAKLTQLVKRASVLAVRVREQGWDDVVANVMDETGLELVAVTAMMHYVLHSD